MTDTALTIIGTQIGTLLAAAIYAWNVKNTLIKATASNDRKMDILHKLANRRMGEALRFGMEQAVINSERSKDAKDIALAEQARAMYDQHQKDQASADAAGAANFNQ